MSSANWILLALVVAEVTLRIFLEIREARTASGKMDRFALLRIIPIVNDIFPAEANFEKFQSGGAFESAHEKAHREEHHAFARVAFQTGFALFCALSIGVAGIQLGLGLFELLILFHLLFAVSRVFFHALCFAEEYEADAIATRRVQYGVARRALEALAASEYPRTPLFALVYRKHPTAGMRLKKIRESRKNKRG